MKLDFFVFGNDTTVHEASKLLIAQAAWFTDEHIKFFKEDSFTIYKSEERAFILRREINFKIGACALECGLDRIESGITSKEFSYSTWRLTTVQSR